MSLLVRFEVGLWCVQVKYVVELARALSQHPSVVRVELLTRLIQDPKVSLTECNICNQVVYTLAPVAVVPSRLNSSPVYAVHVEQLPR